MENYITLIKNHANIVTNELAADKPNQDTVNTALFNIELLAQLARKKNNEDFFGNPPMAIAMQLKGVAQL